MKAFFCAAIALLFLTACSSEKLVFDFGPQPLLDGEETDVSRESAIRSAGFSSISNGSAGSYMSAQYTELQNALRKTNGIAVTRSGHDIDLIMQSAQIFNGVSCPPITAPVWYSFIWCSGEVFNDPKAIFRRRYIGNTASD